MSDQTKYFELIDEAFSDTEKSPEITNLVKELKFWFIDAPAGYFDIIDGRVYLRPSSLYDITGVNFHEEGKKQAERLSSTPIYNNDLTLSDYHISGYGLLLFSKIVGLSHETYTSIITAYTEKEGVIKQRIALVKDGFNESQKKEWNVFIEKLSDMLKVFRNAPAEELSAEEKNFFAVMSYAFAEHLPPSDEEFKLVKFLPTNDNVPALTWEYLNTYIKEPIHKSIEEICSAFKNIDPKDRDEFWNRLGSDATSAIRTKNEITPITLATLRYTKNISEWAYTIAITDIKRLYHHRPAGGLGIRNYIY